MNMSIKKKQRWSWWINLAWTEREIRLHTQGRNTDRKRFGIFYHLQISADHSVKKYFAIVDRITLVHTHTLLEMIEKYFKFFFISFWMWSHRDFARPTCRETKVAAQSPGKQLNQRTNPDDTTQRLATTSNVIITEISARRGETWATNNCADAWRWQQSPLW